MEGASEGYDYYSFQYNFTGEPVWRLQPNDLKLLLYSDVDTVLVTTIMPVVFIIGILGNALIIYVFARVREMQTVTNYFLVNLAVGDMLFLISVVPPKLIQYYSSPLPILEDWSALGDWGCTIISYPCAVAITVSSMTIVLLALEKYVAVGWPYMFKTIRTKPKAIVACTSIWIVAALYCFPEVYVLHLDDYTLVWPPYMNNTPTPDKLHLCFHKCQSHPKQCPPYNHYYMFDRFALIAVVPILTILYAMTLYHLKVRCGNGASSASLKAKKQVVKMLVVTTLIYLVCVTPFRFVSLVQTLHKVKIAPDPLSIIVHVSRILMYINAAINPVIYNVFNERYRKAFQEALCFCKVGNKPLPVTNNYSKPMAQI